MKHARKDSGEGNQTMFQGLGRRFISGFWARVALTLLTAIASAPRVRAQLHIEKPLANLGDIKGGVMLKHRLDLANAGAEPVEIMEVVASCGCLAPRLDQKVLPPGGRGTMTLEIRPLGQPNGPHTWNGLVRYRQGQEVKQTVFTVRANLHNEVTIQPTVVALFVEGTVRKEIILTDHRPGPCKVTQAKVSAAGLRVEVNAVKPGLTSLVLIATGQDMPPGKQQNLLDIHTDDPVYGQFQIPIVLNKITRASVTAVPDQVKLTFAPGQQEASALVRLRGAGKINVAKVESSDPALTCTWAASEEGEVALRVRCRVQPTAPAAQSIRVFTVESKEPVLTIPVRVH